MMKKISCLVVTLMVTHGTVLSMLHTKKIMKNASRLQLQRRTMSGTGLKEFEDVGLLKNQSLEDMKKSLRDMEIKLAKYDQLPQIRQEPLLDVNDKWAIRQAYIDSIYKVAQIEAMGKIYAMSDLDKYQRQELLDKVEDVVKE
jgi:hypothetical protein